MYRAARYAIHMVHVHSFNLLLYIAQRYDAKLLNKIIKSVHKYIMLVIRIVLNNNTNRNKFIMKTSYKLGEYMLSVTYVHM